MSSKPKKFDDPLLDGLRGPRGGRRTPPLDLDEALPPLSLPEEDSGHSNGVLIVLGIGFVAILAILGHFLYQAQGQITQLSDKLEESRQDLSTVSSTLETSQGEISRLNTGLDQSRSTLRAQNQEIERYRGLYDNLKTDQEKHQRELQALNLEKASQTDVAALRDDTSALKGEVDQVSGAVATLEESSATQAGRLDDQAGRLDQATARLDSVESSTRNNSTQIEAVRRSLERDYYNFELQDQGGYMKVQEIHFRLRDIDFEKRLYDLDVLADAKVIRKRNQAINEPIYFFREGEKRPYEVVVTRIDRNLVVGYLAIPKT